MSRRQRLVVMAGVLLLVSVAPVLAAAGGEGPERTPLGWFFRWANFAVIFGGLAYLLLKKIPGAFRRRAEAITASITEAGNVRAEAERRQAEAEEKLARLEDQVAELRAAALRDGEAEAERIRRIASEEAKKISRAARAEIEAAERAARMELKATAARLATERAENSLYQKVTPAVQSALLRSFVDRLGRGA